ncbi:MAG: ABC transporter permease [Erysipelotrichaceae bacterium]|nr:ABC transporter permease [Erysipelotrichaceae bacterium]
MFGMSFILQVIRLSTPILFAAMAAYVAASTGIGNIAIEGIMTMGALFGVLGSYWFQNATIGLLIGICMGVFIALGIAFFSMKLGANPVLIGIALNTFADALAVFILYLICGDKGSSASLQTQFLGTINIPIIKDIPVIGQLLSGHATLTYMSWLFIIVMYVLIFKTPLGLRMRACGLNPSAATTAGINVEKLQVLSLVLSGMLAAFGGVFMTLNYVHVFSKNMIAGQGWMGIAANGIASGNYVLLIITTFIFAVFRAVSISFGADSAFPTDLVKGIPYAAVLVALIGISVVKTIRERSGSTAE